MHGVPFRRLTYSPIPAREDALSARTPYPPLPKRKEPIRPTTFQLRSISKIGRADRLAQDVPVRPAGDGGDSLGMHDVSELGAYLLDAEHCAVVDEVLVAP